MGKLDEEVRRLINRRLQEAAATTFYGVVESVNEQDRICTITAEGVSHEEVLIYAVQKATLKGFCLIPKVGSVVGVSMLGGGSRLYVSLFSEVDKVLLTVGKNTSLTVDENGTMASVGKSSLKITEQGFTLERDGVGLKKTMEALLDALAKLTVPTGVGPSGIPVNAADFTKIKQELSKFMEE